MRADPESFVALLDKQRLVFRRKQAIDRGVKRQSLRWRLKTGRYQVLLPGVWGAFSGTPTEEQLLIAAVLYGGEGAYVTGAAGCRRYWLTKAPYDGTILVATTRKLSPVKFQCFDDDDRGHRRSLAELPREVRFIRSTRATVITTYPGVPTGAAPLCVVQAALGMRSIDGVRALLAQAVQKDKASVAELIAETKGAPLRGSAFLRKALNEVVGGARSAAEAKNVRLTKRSKVLPQLHYNCTLMGPRGFIAKPDAYAEESGVAQEIDSVEWHIDAAPWRATQERRSRMVSHGVAVLDAAPSRLDTDPSGMLDEFERTHLIELRSGPPPGVWVECRADCPLRDRPRIVTPGTVARAVPRAMVGDLGPARGA